MATSADVGKEANDQRHRGRSTENGQSRPSRTEAEEVSVDITDNAVTIQGEQNAPTRKTARGSIAANGAMAVSVG
jgi:hypothetical protein